MILIKADDIFFQLIFLSFGTFQFPGYDWSMSFSQANIFSSVFLLFVFIITDA